MDIDRTKNMTIKYYKDNIFNWINAYLENDDEYTTMYGEKFRKIQNNDEKLTKLAEKLYNNEVLSSIDDIDSFNYERNYYISELLDKESD